MKNQEQYEDFDQRAPELSMYTEVTGTSSATFAPPNASVAGETRYTTEFQRPQKAAPMKIISMRDMKLASKYKNNSEQRNKPGKAFQACSCCFVLLASLTTMCAFLAFLFAYVPIKNEVYSQYYNQNTGTDYDFDFGGSSIGHHITDFVLFLIFSCIGCCALTLPCFIGKGMTSGSAIACVSCLFCILLPIQIATLSYELTLDDINIENRYQESDFFYRANFCGVFEGIADRYYVREDYVYNGAESFTSSTLPLCRAGIAFDFFALFSNLGTIVSGFILVCFNFK